ARRSALGLTWDDKLVLVTVHTKISLNKLSHIMLRLGCTEAAALDGGSSTALYCNGEFISKPSRRLSNVLLVYD
ncbi:MAG: phosphodiester glycosidase family protein, partial [Armatimonadia bacterium]